MREIDIPKDFSILDTTLREGQQGVHPQRPKEGVVFTREQQMRIAELLEEFGINFIEVGSPVDSRFHLETIKRIADVLKDTNTQLFVHCRCSQKDIDAALAAKPSGVNLYLGTSSVENRNGNGARSIKEVAGLAKNAIEYTRGKNRNLIVRFSAEDAFRTPIEDLVAVLGSVGEIVDRIGLPDTTGCAYPHQVYDVVTEIRSFLGGKKEIEFHGHNDRGLALANYLEALRAGANIFDTTVLGIGERNGIASLSGWIAALYGQNTKEKLSERYDLKLLPVIDQEVAEMLGVGISHIQPLTSSGAFTHTSGVHINGHLNSKDSYRSLPPEEFGRTTLVTVASSVVGGSAVTKRGLELGILMDKNQARGIASIIREEARENGGITPDEVDEIILSNYQAENE